MNHKARFSLLQFCFATSLGVGAGSLVLAADTESSARVERFRNALIDKALEAPVRVTSSAWLDESGQLRHVSRFFSEIRARAASDVLFQAAEASSAPAEPGSREVAGQARVSAPSQAPGQQLATGPAAATPSVVQPIPKAAQTPAASAGKSTATSVVSPGIAPGSESAVPCRSGSGDLARLAVLDSLIFPSDGARGHSILQEFERVLRDSLVERSRSGGLRLAALEPVSADPYARLISSTGDLDSPYRIELRIHSDRVDQPPPSLGSHPDNGMLRQAVWAGWRTVTELVSTPAARMPDRRVDISLTLKEQFGAAVLLEKSFSVRVSGLSPSHNSVVIPDPAVAEVRAAVASWWREANEKLRCQMLMVRASPSPVGRVSIPMGAASGVRVGDRWVIGDSAKIPARVLEPGSLERALLAEVVAVGNHKSVLRLSVDQGAARVLFSVEKGASWFATPL